MKNHYIHPQIGITPIYHSLILCSSGDRISSNINIKGGDNSGDVTQAF
jgi:hypothetical protein